MAPLFDAVKRAAPTVSDHRGQRVTATRTLAAATTALAAAGLTATGAALGVSLANRRWARADHPWTEDLYGLPDVETTTVVTRDGAHLSVAVAGAHHDGPTVVLSHCWTGDHRVWAPVAKRLAAHHRVVLYDQRGHGGSTIGADGLTIEALGDDLHDVVVGLALGEVVVAGHSMGGMATQAFAIRHPEVLRQRVTGLALVATGCDGLRTTPFARVAGPAIGWRLTDRSVGRAALGPVLVRGTVGRRARLADLRIVAETFAATPRATRLEFLQRMVVMDLSGGLSEVEVPVTIVCGTRDLLTPLARSRRLAEVLPHARLEIIEHAGHMLPCEEPDRVGELIRELVAARTVSASGAAAEDRALERTAP